jgi:alpha-glucosidase (family GH31 glycosyl hydrolase)
MKKRLLLLSISFIYLTLINAQNAATNTPQRLALKVSNKAAWWSGVVNDGSLMPMKSGYKTDFTAQNYGNQVQPLLLSKDGEVIWSDAPFAINYTNDSLIIEGKTAKITYSKAGKTLKEAYQFAAKNYFNFNGKTPDKLLFSQPQYNTWIELMYNQNENDILKYAQAIIDNGFTPGVLMIDDNWQQSYGTWDFRAERFKAPKEMMDKLHKMGFKVMLWVCPFVSGDTEIGREVVKNKLVLLNKNGEPALVNWWNGYSLLLDFSNPKAVDWFKNVLNNLTKNYGVDGFKLDAGDFRFYENLVASKPNFSMQDQSEAYGKIGLDYPLNEYRALWKMGGQPIANRLSDKNHSWEALETLIPNMIEEGLMGYAYSCPDMIGGGEFTSFLATQTIDPELIVRSAQCHALMPMMQFSVAPWRILDKTHLAAVQKSVKLRAQFRDYILKTVDATAKSGEPIMRPLEYDFPNMGYDTIKNQFLIGADLLVAPILEKKATKRTIIVPKGTWKNADGQVFKGPKTIEVKVDLETLPYLIKIE